MTVLLGSIGALPVGLKGKLYGQPLGQNSIELILSYP